MMLPLLYVSAPLQKGAHIYHQRGVFIRFIL